MLNSNKVTELFPEVGEDTEAIPDTRAENDDLLSHVTDDDPPKVKKLPVLDIVAKDAEEELYFRSAVGPLHRVMVVLKADKVADSICLFTRTELSSLGRTRLLLQSAALIVHPKMEPSTSKEPSRGDKPRVHNGNDFPEPHTHGLRPL